MASQVVERLTQEMAEGHDNQDETECDEGVTRAQTQDDESPGHEFDQRDGNAGQPEGPDRQKAIAKWQKIFPGVLQWAQLKNFPDTGHEEDQAENETREQECPGAVKVFGHRRKLTADVADYTDFLEIQCRKTRCVGTAVA